MDLSGLNGSQMQELEKRLQSMSASENEHQGPSLSSFLGETVDFLAQTTGNFFLRQVIGDTLYRPLPQASPSTVIATTPVLHAEPLAKSAKAPTTAPVNSTKSEAAIQVVNKKTEGKVVKKEHGDIVLTGQTQKVFEGVQSFLKTALDRYGSVSFTLPNQTNTYMVRPDQKARFANLTALCATLNFAKTTEGQEKATLSLEQGAVSELALSERKETGLKVTLDDVMPTATQMDIIMGALSKKEVDIADFMQSLLGAYKAPVVVVNEAPKALTLRQKEAIELFGNEPVIAAKRVCEMFLRDAAMRLAQRSTPEAKVKTTSFFLPETSIFNVNAFPLQRPSSFLVPSLMLMQPSEIVTAPTKKEEASAANPFIALLSPPAKKEEVKAVNPFIALLSPPVEKEVNAEIGTDSLLAALIAVTEENVKKNEVALASLNGTIASTKVEEKKETGSDEVDADDSIKVNLTAPTVVDSSASERTSSEVTSGVANAEMSSERKAPVEESGSGRVKQKKEAPTETKPTRGVDEETPTETKPTKPASKDPTSRSGITDSKTSSETKPKKKPLRDAVNSKKPEKKESTWTNFNNKYVVIQKDDAKAIKIVKFVALILKWTFALPITLAGMAVAYLYDRWTVRQIETEAKNAKKGMPNKA